MPRAKDTLRVEINEATADETRTITITITTPAQDFLLADLLRQRGALGALDAPLKQTVKEAIQGYLERAEDLIAGVAAGQKKGGANFKTKTQNAPEEAAVSREPARLNGAQHSQAEP